MKLSGSIFVSTAILLFGVTVAHGAAVISPAEVRVRSLREATPRSPASFRLRLPLALKYQERLKQPVIVSLHRLPTPRADAVELNRFGLRRIAAKTTATGVEAHESR